MFNFFKRSSPAQSLPEVEVDLSGIYREEQPAKKATHAQQVNQLRYAAAKSERLIKRVGGGVLSVDETLRRDLNNLRSASRQGGEDIGYVKKYFGMVQTHVVGDKGFRLQAEPRLASGKIDKRSAQSIETAYKEFNKLGVCEISGRMNGISADQLIVKTVSQDGDVLIRHIDGADNKFGYAFQIIESDRLDTSLYKDLGGGKQIKMGVEIDAYGRHLAYHILTSHPGEYTYAHGHRKYIRIPASEIILPFPMWRPGQTRGVPWAHAALLEMHDIGGYRESMAVGARLGAANMAVYERDPELAVSDEQWTDEGEFLVELEPGGATISPEGYRLRETKFQMPGEGFGSFQKAALRGSASGMDVNYNVLGNDYEGVSWSTMRQAILEDRDHWKRLQGWYISQVKTPIYERWLRNALLKGAIDGLRAYDLARVAGHQFAGRRWQWVDPLKDEQAVGEAMGNFTINPMDVLNDKGVDLEQMQEGWVRYLDVMGPAIQAAQKLGFGNKKMQSMSPAPKENPEEN